MIYSLKNRKLLFLLLLCAFPFFVNAQSNEKGKKYSIKRIEEIARPYIDSVYNENNHSKNKVIIIGINNLKKSCVSFFISDVMEKKYIYMNDHNYYYYYDQNNELILVKITQENAKKLVEKLKPWVNSEQIIDSLLKKGRLTEIEITGSSRISMYIVNRKRIYQKIDPFGFAPSELGYDDYEESKFKNYTGDSRKMFEDFMKIYYKCGCGDK